MFRTRCSLRCRLNYSNMPEDKIVEGIKRMAEVIKEELAEHAK